MSTKGAPHDGQDTVKMGYLVISPKVQQSEDRGSRHGHATLNIPPWGECALLCLIDPKVRKMGARQAEGL